MLGEALQSAEGWGAVCGCDAAVACEVVEHLTQPDGLAVSMLGAIRCVWASSEESIASCARALADHAISQSSADSQPTPRPRVAIMTTPNLEYNAVIRHVTPAVSAGDKLVASDGFAMRDSDHKFEWTRAEFEAWARAHAATFGYSVTFCSVGRALKATSWRSAAEVEAVGGATQVRLAGGRGARERGGRG